MILQPHSWAYIQRKTWVENIGNPLQYSHLENAMDGGAWWATVHRVTELVTTEVT